MPCWSWGCSRRRCGAARPGASSPSTCRRAACTTWRCATGWPSAAPRTASPRGSWCWPADGRARPGARPALRREAADDPPASFARVLAERVNPLWALGRNTLLGWRPVADGIEVLIVRHQDVLERLLHGPRLMADDT